MAAEVILTSELTYPHCGYRQIETMPTDACATSISAQLQHDPAAKGRRLLRLLLFWLCPLPARASRAALL